MKKRSRGTAEFINIDGTLMRTLYSYITVRSRVEYPTKTESARTISTDHFVVRIA